MSKEKVTVYQIWVNGQHKSTCGNYTTAENLKNSYEQCGKNVEIKMIDK